MKTKKCSKCKRYKTLDSFHKNKDCKYGVSSICKACIAKVGQKYYLKNRDKIIAREAKKYICNSADKHKARKYKRAVTLKYRYKITEEDYSKLYDKQKGKCAICGVVPRKNLHIDHDHNYNTIRGLLCQKCNRGLGHFDDDIKKFKEAIKYLYNYKLKVNVE